MKQILILTAIGFLTACASTPKTEADRQPQQVIGQVDAEKNALLKSFTTDAASTAMQIMEPLFKDKLSNKTVSDYYPAIKASFIRKANDPKSKLYKYLKIDSLYAAINLGRSSGIEFPIKAEDVKIFGIDSHSVDERERCEYGDEKTSKEICSYGWKQDNVLLGVKRLDCHNSGCDTSTVYFLINVTHEAEKTEGSVMTGRNYKVISPSYISVSVDSPYRLDMPYTKDYQ